MDLLSKVRASCRDLVTAPRNQLPSLDVLRTIAVLLVITQHFAHFGKIEFLTLSGTFDSPAFRPSQSGPLGVYRATPFYTPSRLSYGMYLDHLAILRWITPAVSRAARRATGTATGALPWH